jgi:hypothetical protein
VRELRIGWWEKREIEMAPICYSVKTEEGNRGIRIRLVNSTNLALSMQIGRNKKLKIKFNQVSLLDIISS